MAQQFSAYLAFLFTCIFPLLLSGQTTKNYQGGFNINGLGGEADFNYYIQKGDTIFHGPFRFSKSGLEEPKDKLSSVVFIAGGFNRNKAEGNWEMHKGRFVPVGKGSFKDYSLVYKINGNETFINGNFRDGKPTGTWELYEWHIKGSELSDTLLAATFPFGNENPVGSFSFKTGNGTLAGEINGQGKAHGTWSFSSRHFGPYTEEWVFKDGHLTLRRVNFEGKTTELQVSEATEMGPSGLIPMGEKYFRIIDLKTPLNNKNSRPINDSINAGAVFLKAMEKFKVFDTLFLVLAKTSILPEIKAVIEKQPFAAGEIEAFNSIRSNVKLSDSLASGIQNDAQVNISRLAIPEINWYAAVIKTFQEKFIGPMDSLMNLFDGGYLNYLNRDRYIGQNIRMNREITVEVPPPTDTPAKNYSFTNLNIGSNLSPVAQLSAFSIALLEEIILINDSLQARLQSLKKEKKLVVLEENLMEQYKLARSHIDSLIGPQHQALAGYDIKSALEAIAETQLSRYSALQSTDEKSRQIEPLLECIQQLRELAITISNLPSMRERLEKAYTVKVFNPYTYTEMEETAKEPIYRAYNRVIFPALMENIQGLQCGKVGVYNKNFDKLFTGMFDLLKADTRKTERKIKRVRDPQRAADILNLNIQL